MSKSFYKMYAQEHFAVVKFAPGIFTLEEAKRINHEYKADPEFYKIHYLVIILSDCIPNFTTKELPEITDFYSKAYQTNNHVNTAWVVDEPIATAFTHLFIHTTPENSEYCSTLEKAYLHLGLNMTYDNFIELIKKSIAENE